MAAIAKPRSVATSAIVATVVPEKAPLHRPAGRRRITKKVVPGRRFEQELWDAGADVVVGLDEVGRGAWAGPLVIGAAVIPRDKRIQGVRDSKLLSEPERERMYDKVAPWCRAWSIGSVSQQECDTIGMSAAQKLAARRALDSLGLHADAILVDGSWDFVGTGNVQRLIKGDATCLSIAAASVLAKVTRDPRDARRGRALPLLVIRRQQGLSVPQAQSSVSWLGPQHDPSSIMGLHGSNPVGHRPRCSAGQSESAVALLN